MLKGVLSSRSYERRKRVGLWLLFWVRYALTYINALHTNKLQDDKKKKSKDKEKESSSTSSSAASTPKLPGTPQKKEADILPSTPELTKKQLKQQEKDQKKKDKELKKLLKKEVKNKGKATDEDASPITSPALLTSSIGTPKTDSPQLTKSELDSDEDISDDEAPTILLSPTERQKLFETIGFDQALADVLEEKLPPEVFSFLLFGESKVYAVYQNENEFRSWSDIVRTCW